MGPMGELGALFNPGMRHEIEERKAKANRREEAGDSDGGNLRIDLLSGVAVISMSPARAASPAAPAAESESESESETETESGSGTSADAEAADTKPDDTKTDETETDDTRTDAAETDTAGQPEEPDAPARAVPAGAAGDHGTDTAALPDRGAPDKAGRDDGDDGTHAGGPAGRARDGERG